MKLLLRTAEQDRVTTAQSWMSMALSMLALLQDDELALDFAFVMLLYSYIGLLSVSQSSRRCAKLPALKPASCSFLRAPSQLAEALQPRVHLELREHVLRVHLLGCVPLPQGGHAVPKKRETSFSRGGTMPPRPVGSSAGAGGPRGSSGRDDWRIRSAPAL